MNQISTESVFTVLISTFPNLCDSVLCWISASELHPDWWWSILVSLVLEVGLSDLWDLRSLCLMTWCSIMLETDQKFLSEDRDDATTLWRILLCFYCFLGQNCRLCCFSSQGCCPNCLPPYRCRWTHILLVLIFRVCCSVVHPGE